jgi:hypothetical protein
MTIVTTIVALAGCRIDAEDSVPRFPLDQAPYVQERLDALLRELYPSALICSAACGADLLALEVAAELHIPVTIVLPFESDRFRESSVVDRPGEWGPRFDAVMARVAGAPATGRIHVVEPHPGEDRDAYVTAIGAILDNAQELAAAAGRETELVAVVVWDGAERGKGSLTEYFRRSARRRGFKECEISTLPEV